MMFSRRLHELLHIIMSPPKPSEPTGTENPGPLEQAQIKKADRDGIILGFSGVNAAFLIIFAALRPYSRLGTLCAASPAIRYMVLIDIVGFFLQLVSDFSSPLAHGGHLGGYLAGAVANYFLHREANRRKKRGSFFDWLL
jgi:membrane associated rhomboid family serine protease